MNDIFIKLCSPARSLEHPHCWFRHDRVGVPLAGPLATASAIRWIVAEENSSSVWHDLHTVQCNPSFSWVLDIAACVQHCCPILRCVTLEPASPHALKMETPQRWQKRLEMSMQRRRRRIQAIGGVGGVGEAGEEARYQRRWSCSGGAVCEACNGD